MAGTPVLTIRVLKQGDNYAAEFVGRAPDQIQWESPAVLASTPVKAVKNALDWIIEVADSGRGRGRKRRGYKVALYLATGTEKSK